MTEQSSIVFIYHIAFIYCSVICLWAFKFMHCHGYYNSTIHMETQVTHHGAPFIMTFFSFEAWFVFWKKAKVSEPNLVTKVGALNG